MKTAIRNCLAGLTAITLIGITGISSDKITNRVFNSRLEAGVHCDSKIIAKVGKDEAPVVRCYYEIREDGITLYKGMQFIQKLDNYRRTITQSTLYLD